MANIVAQGQITFIDVSDAKSLSSWIQSNQPKIQIRNGDTGALTPNWTNNNVVLTPELYVSGTGTNIIGEMKSIKWYEGSTYLDPAALPSGYAIGATNPKALTISANKLSAGTPQITYVAEITWTDTDTKVDVIVKTEIEFAQVASGAKGETGSQGIQGPTGPTGATLYTWIKYADDAAGSGMADLPTGKSYMGIAYNKSSSTESNTASDYTWSLIEGPQGDQGVQGPKGTDGVTTYTWIKYGTSATGAGITDSPAGMTYIGIAYNKTTSAESNNASDYTWSLIQGPKGDKGDTGAQGLQGIQGIQGDQGIQGVKGADGVSSYTHIAYSTSPTGATGFSTSDPTNATYIGMYVDSTAADSTDPAKYNWSLIKGADGAQGIQGPTGSDGQTSYLHIAYATSADGSVGFSTTDSAGKTYIGQYTDFTAADSTTASKYSWTLIKGATGADAVIAYAWTPNGNVIKNGSGNLSAQADLYEGGTKVTSGITYQWYKLISGTWTALTSAYTGYNGATLTITAANIESTSSFKCKMTYKTVSYEDVVTLIDQTDPIQAVPSSNGGTVFRNGEGTTKTVTGKLFQSGAEIDVAGTAYTYKWYMKAEDGSIDPNFGGTGVNFKTGKVISLSPSEVNNIGNLVLDVWSKD